MLISVEQAKQEINDFKGWADEKIERKLKAIEQTIRSHTHNNFQLRNFRGNFAIFSQKLYGDTSLFKIGDTVQISESIFNDGIYTIDSIDDKFVELDKALIDEPHALVTKVEYPADVVECAIDMIEWDVTKPDVSKRNIQSETLSRHSVTYVQPSDANMVKGYPKDIMDALKPYMKARV